MVLRTALVAHGIQFVTGLSVFQSSVLICHSCVAVILCGIGVAHVDIRGFYLRLDALVTIAICDSAFTLRRIVGGGIALSRERKTECLRREILCGIVVGTGINVLVGLFSVIRHLHMVFIRHTGIYITYLLSN